MNNFLLLPLFLATLIGNVAAMEAPSNSAAKKGRALMDGQVYDVMAKHLEEGTFSDEQVKLYKTFPTQELRDHIRNGEKPGYVTSFQKVESLIDFFNSAFGKKAAAVIQEAKAVCMDEALMQDLKNKRCLDNAAEEIAVNKHMKILYQADALLELMGLLIEEKRALKGTSEIPVAIKNLGESGGSVHGASLRRPVSNAIQSIENEPKRRADEAERKRKDDEERKKKEEVEQERKRRVAESEIQEKEAQEALIKEAKALYNTVEGQMKRTPLERTLGLFEEKINNETLTRNDFTSVENCILYTQALKEGRKVWKTPLDISFNQLALVRHLNGGLDVLILGAIDKLLKHTSLSDEEQQQLNALDQLIECALSASRALEESLDEEKALRERHQTIEDEGLVASLSHTERTGLLKKLCDAEYAFAAKSNEERKQAVVVRSNAMNKLSKNTALDKLSNYLILGGGVIENINDAAVDTPGNAFIEADSLISLTERIKENRKTQAIILLNAEEDAARVGMRFEPKWLPELKVLLKQATQTPTDLNENLYALLVNTEAHADTISYSIIDEIDTYPLDDVLSEEITAFLQAPAKATENSLQKEKNNKKATQDAPGNTSNTSSRLAGLTKKFFTWKVLIPVACIAAALVGSLFFYKHSLKRPTAKKNT